MKTRLPLKVTTLCALPLLAVALTAHARDLEPGRPRIEGIAHMAYYVGNVSQARAYYEDFLGFEEAFALKNADGSDHVVFVKVNDRQFIELFVEPPTSHGFLHDLAFWTSDAAAVRAALTARAQPVSGVSRISRAISASA